MKSVAGSGTAAGGLTVTLPWTDLIRPGTGAERVSQALLRLPRGWWRQLGVTYPEQSHLMMAVHLTTDGQPRMRYIRT